MASYGLCFTSMQFTEGAFFWGEVMGIFILFFSTQDDFAFLGPKIFNGGSLKMHVRPT